MLHIAPAPANPRAFTRLHWAVLGGITLVWTVAGLLFAQMYVADYPRYRPLGYGTALACGLALGLIHLGWLALFRSRAACWGMLIAKLAAIPVTIGGGFFALAIGVMGSDGGVENAAQQLHVLLPFCMALAAAPTTLAALVGAGLGHVVGRGQSRAPASAAASE